MDQFTILALQQMLRANITDQETIDVRNKINHSLGIIAIQMCFPIFSVFHLKASGSCVTAPLCSHPCIAWSPVFSYFLLETIGGWLPIFHVQKEEGSMMPVLYSTRRKLWLIKLYCSTQGKFNLYTCSGAGHKMWEHRCNRDFLKLIFYSDLLSFPSQSAHAAWQHVHTRRHTHTHTHTVLSRLKL